MANMRPKSEEIVSKLRQVDVLMGQEMSRLDATRQIGLFEQSYYRWRKKCGGMGIDQLNDRSGEIGCNAAMGVLHRRTDAAMQRKSPEQSLMHPPPGQIPKFIAADGMLVIGKKSAGNQISGFIPKTLEAVLARCKACS